MSACLKPFAAIFLLELVLDTSAFNTAQSLFKSRVPKEPCCWTNSPSTIRNKLQRHGLTRARASISIQPADAMPTITSQTKYIYRNIEINSHPAIVINDSDSRLMEDLRQFLLKIAPPGLPYLHNDLHLRPQSEEDQRRVVANGWDIADPAALRAWRAEETPNAHAHLLATLLGASETLPVAAGRLALGSWQCVLAVDLDGPRRRSVAVQLVGF